MSAETCNRVIENLFTKTNNETGIFIVSEHSQNTFSLIGEKKFIKIGSKKY